jgi:hypothetical protein
MLVPGLLAKRLRAGRTHAPGRGPATPRTVPPVTLSRANSQSKPVQHCWPSPGWLVLEAATLALTSATVTLTRGAVAGERRIAISAVVRPRCVVARRVGLRGVREGLRCVIAGIRWIAVARIRPIADASNSGVNRGPSYVAIPNVTSHAPIVRRTVVVVQFPFPGAVAPVPVSVACEGRRAA